MKRLLTGLLAVILLLLAGVTVLAFRAVQDTPLVTGDGVLSPSAVGRAKEVIRINDPRRLRPGAHRESRVLARDLETLVNLALRQGQATVVLEEGLADLRYTLPMPSTPLGRYLNLWARVSVGPEGVEFQKVRVGTVPIPGPLFRMGLDYVIGKSEIAPDLILLRQSIQSVSFVPGELRIRYIWKPEILDSARARVLPPEARERLAAAHLRLVTHMDRAGDGRRQAPLAEVLGPLLQEAASGKTDSELGQAYRNLLLVAAFQLSGRNIAQLVPEAAQWPRPRPLTLTLRGREDLAQHFMVSAALAAWAGEPLASAVGVSKEVDDARGGSGFSFADLAADRAGTRLGELVAGNPQRLAAAVGAGLSDTALLPPVTDLPESMMAAEFQRRFGGVGAPAYQRMSDEIDRRIDALSLFR